MKSKEVQMTLNYVYRIKPGDELKVNADVFLDSGGFDMESYSTYYIRRGEQWEENPDMPRYAYIQHSPQDGNIYSASADYKHTFKNRSFITAGAKFTCLEVSNNTSFETPADGGGWEEDLGRSDDFDYNETISALYVKYDMNGKKWAYTFSGRAEFYGTNSISNTLSKTFRQRILGIFPHVNIRYYIDRMKGTSIGFNLGRSIMRRSFQELNPNVIQSSDFAQRYGNAYLDPSYVNKAGISATIKYMYNISLNYSLTDNLYSSVTRPNPDQENGTVSSPEKIKFHHRLYLSAFLPFRFTKWWNGMANLGGGYTWYNLLGETYDGFSGDMFISSNFALPKDWGLELSWFGYLGGVNGNKQSSSAQSVNFSVRKKLFKEKNGTLSVGVNDLFNSGNGGRTYLTSPALYSYNKIYRDSRSFYVSFRYNFNHGLRKTGRYIEKDMENKSRVM